MSVIGPDSQPGQPASGFQRFFAHGCERHAQPGRRRQPHAGDPGRIFKTGYTASAVSRFRSSNVERFNSSLLCLLSSYMSVTHRMSPPPKQGLIPRPREQMREDSMDQQHLPPRFTWSAYAVWLPCSRGQRQTSSQHSAWLKRANRLWKYAPFRKSNWSAALQSLLMPPRRSFVSTLIPV